MRRALAGAVRDDNELRHTKDIIRQWQELILGSVGVVSKAVAAPVLIVIDALDESGDTNSRKHILRLLAGKLDTSPSQLPVNLRVLVTSRSLEDIDNALLTASHVRHISMDSDDNISPASAERDIQLYISTELTDLRNIFEDVHFQTLARKSDGLFEWARLACEHIKGTNIVSRGPMPRFRELAETSAKGRNLLDDIYRRILTEIMPENTHEKVIPVFRSVMGQVLASLEPLPMTALTIMRRHFSCDVDYYDVKSLVGKLGSLVTGTADSQSSIRPLHTSFYDFLTDKLRSDKFFVDVSSVKSDLAFASLRIMKEGLRFNICSLESSYLPNSAIPDLEKRVKESIPAELSYSCRFWGTHVQAATFELSLANEISAFFNGERLLFWLEALAVMKDLSSSVGSLECIADWLTGHAECTHIGDAVRDTQRFIRTFGAIILHSTPHLYLSALPFAPTGTRIFQKFAAEFPNTPQIVAGHIVKWPMTEKILHWHCSVFSVAISPDGRRIVCGSQDGTIQVWDAETGEALGAPLELDPHHITSVVISSDGKRIVSGLRSITIRIWDAETGEALGAPLQGHIGPVFSVAISPDGTRIVSGSLDTTIMIWNAETGKTLVAPLQGHTGPVFSVAISPDRTRIVSGSYDKTIRIWNAETGEVLGAPLQGHTSPIFSVAISPDGTRIVSGSSDAMIRKWDAETGEALGVPLQGHTGGIYSVAISLDGRRIVSGSRDKTIRIWDAETGEALGAPLQGHTDGIRSVATSSDGRRIVSGSRDRTIRIWDRETDKALGVSVQGHMGPISSVAISPDGHRGIVSGSQDETRVSPNPTHALRPASSFLHGSPVPLPRTDGWVVDPEGRLLFWTPDFHTSTYFPGNTLVAPNDASKFDLSHFAHGNSWHECRKQKVAL
ncbi:hypothetical protein AZE42_00167 [Rhizopogon vesiculosus]|uniref:Nephrocystin 3-like N-terminal domain-containing protein n=1 Tax=Rhizopogon vesiculosus TaxID=180088 RepID=A0A1J8QZY6_9AGAM|nr:hypothetical protein AZE42_00167 [Rhizopogon vesiculosus]